MVLNNLIILFTILFIITHPKHNHCQSRLNIVHQQQFSPKILSCHILHRQEVLIYSWRRHFNTCHYSGLQTHVFTLIWNQLYAYQTTWNNYRVVNFKTIPSSLIVWHLFWKKYRCTVIPTVSFFPAPSRQLFCQASRILNCLIMSLNWGQEEVSLRQHPNGLLYTWLNAMYCHFYLKECLTGIEHSLSDRKSVASHDANCMFWLLQRDLFKCRPTYWLFFS